MWFMRVEYLFLCGFLIASCVRLGAEIGADVLSKEMNIVTEKQLDDFWGQAFEEDAFESPLEMEPIPLVRLWVMKLGGPFVLYYFALKNKIVDWYCQLKMKLKKNRVFNNADNSSVYDASYKK